MKKIIIICIAISLLFVSTLFANENIESLLKKGKDAIETGKYQEAVTCLGKILTASGNETTDPEITAFGATVQAYGLLNMNNPQMRPMAKQYLETAIEKDPKWKFPKQLLKSVESYSKTPKKESDEIMQIYMRVLKGDNVTKEEAQKVEQSFKKKIAEKPNDLRGHQALGVLYERTGQMDKAIESYTKSLGDKAETATAYDFFGQFYARNKNSKKSIECFEKAVKMEPTNAVFVSNLAGPYLEAEQYDEAIKLYKEAMQLDPNNIRFQMRLANAYMLAGMDEKAIEECENILKKKPGQNNVEAMLNHLYQKSGKGNVHPMTTAAKMKSQMEEMGYRPDITQQGNIVVVKPTYYKKGEAPISNLENRVSQEFKLDIADIRANNK